MPELRKDIVTREWIILAKERAKRPSDFSKADREEIPKTDPATCPFCPGNEHMTPPELLAYRRKGTERNGPGWWVRVIPNKFAALSYEGTLEHKEVGIYDVMPGVGAHEVVVEMPEHDKQLFQADKKQIEEVIWAYRDRYMALREDPRIKYILIFKNYGVTAGSSIAHSHSQIVGTPVIPQKIMSKIRGVDQYREYVEKCVYCDVIDWELQDGERVVSENESFVTIAPFASRSPFHLLILPKEHCSCFARMDRITIADFASILKDTLVRLDKCLNNPPYNYTLITAPVESDQLENFHWHLEIIPRLTTPAGFEIGTSIYINVTPPEEAARYLREISVDEGECKTG
jgi:UDPglucose--hexose-1-phosphate uridylyltransferase